MFEYVFLLIQLFSCFCCYTDIPLQENTVPLPILVDIGANPRLPKNPQNPIIYSVKSLTDLETKHAEKLSNKNNTFYLKDSKGSLYYDPQTNMWTGIEQADTSVVVKKQYLDWFPISSCLDSRFGSGGVISRSVKVAFEATTELDHEIQLRSNPIGFQVGIEASTGFKVGTQVETTLLFSCSLNKGDICQMQYRPSYITVPIMLKTAFKFNGKKFTPYKVKLLKSFKLLLLETPEHRCWITKDRNNIHCKDSISNYQLLDI